MQLQVEYVDISTIKPYKGNAKEHPKEQIEQIKKSMQEFGVKDPIGIWHNEIVEGHGRYLALKELGETQVPVIRLDDLTDEQRRAYTLVHNQLTMNSGFNLDTLKVELDNIGEIDMSEFGFSLDGIGEEPQEVQEDDFDVEPPEEPTSKLGDIYQLGEHRLMCGDSMNPEHVAKLMDGHKARMIFTSPPYSDMREYNGGKDISVSNLAKFIGAYKDYCDFQCVNLGLQYKDKEIYPYWDGFIKEAHDDGLKLLAWNVWDKLEVGSIGMQKHMFPVRHEWIFVFGEDEIKTNKTWEKRDHAKRKEECTLRRQSDGSTRYSSTRRTNSKYKPMESVLSVHSEKGSIRSEHPAVFPVQLPAEYIKSLTDSDDGVIEPFCGSGSTLIACEQLGRKCYGMELDPRYMDVIIKRWEEYTGKKAVKIA